MSRVTLPRPPHRSGPTRAARRAAWLGMTLFALLSLPVWSAAAPRIDAAGPHQAGDVCSPDWIRLLSDPATTTRWLGDGGGARLAERAGGAWAPSTGGSWPTAEADHPVMVGTILDDASRSAEAVGGPVPAQDDTSQVPYVRYPNDPYFRLYQRESLMAMGALDAWDVSRGADDVTVAVVSTGVDYTHPDLAAKIWHNVDEVPANGVDDDANGYVDDVRGWNFTDANADPMDAPKYGKGSPMAGIAAAHTNNATGVSGVSWGARIMPLKTLSLREDENGARFVGSVRDVVEAVCYAANNEADVVLIGGYLYDPESAVDDVDLLRQSIEYAHRAGAVVVAPAGDCATPQPFCPPEESYGANPTILPAAFTHVIGAQSYTQGYARRDEASFGPWVDITAPGERFRTTAAGDTPYPWVRGGSATSDFAAAHVAGVVAVMRSVNADLSPFQIEKALCQSADRTHGEPYESGPVGARNDGWGCGVMDFEAAVESLPPRIRVEPRSVTQYTDGSEPSLSVVLSNRFLRAGAWTVFPSRATWLRSDELAEPADLLSVATVIADMSALREEHGQLQSGDTVTDTLYACPLGWEQDDAYDDLCQRIPYRLTFVEWTETVLLPFAASAYVLE